MNRQWKSSIPGLRLTGELVLLCLSVALVIPVFAGPGDHHPTPASGQGKADSRPAPFAGTKAQAAATITKAVMPEGEVKYGDELTYTLVVSAAPGTQLGLYDPLTDTTYLRFVERPPGISYADRAITGTLTVTPAHQITVSFVTQVGVPGTTGIHEEVSNKACSYPSGQTVDACQWSNVVANQAFYPHNIYLPLLPCKKLPKQGFFIGSFGGESSFLAIQDNLAYAGEGSQLAIVDISCPTQPVKISQLGLPGKVNHVQIVGDLAYVAAEYGGLVIVDVTRPSTPRRLGHIPSEGVANYVQVVGDLAYISTSTALEIADVSNPDEPKLRSRFTTSAQRTEVVGDLLYIDAYELQILDVSDPDNPVLLGSFRHSDPYGGTVDLLQVVANRAYLTGLYYEPGKPGQWRGDFLIVDVSDPANPAPLGRHGEEHEIVAAQVVGNFAYLKVEFLGLHVVEISDRYAIGLVGEYDLSGSVSDFQVVGSLAYVLTRNFSSWPFPGRYYCTVTVLDISNPGSPVLVSQYEMDDASYKSIQVVGSAAFIRTSGFLIIDVSSPAEPDLLGEYQAEQYEAHQIQVVNGLAYVMGDDTLRIIDIHDLNAPTVLGNFGSYASRRVLQGLAQVVDDLAYLIASRPIAGTTTTELCLAIVDVSNPSAPTLIAEYGGDGGARSVFVVDNLAYVGTGRGLHILDVTEPHDPTLLGTWESESVAAITVVDNLAYLHIYNTMQIVDVSEPTNPVPLGAYEVLLPDYIVAMTVANNQAYVGLSDGEAHSIGRADEKVHILDVSNPISPTLVSTYTVPVTYAGYDKIASLHAVNDRLYVAVNHTGVQLVDVSDPASPTPVYTYPADAYDVYESGNLGYIAAGEGGVQVVAFSDAGGSYGNRIHLHHYALHLAGGVGRAKPAVLAPGDRRAGTGVDLVSGWRCVPGWCSGRPVRRQLLAGWPDLAGNYRIRSVDCTPLKTVARWRCRGLPSVGAAG